MKVAMSPSMSIFDYQQASTKGFAAQNAKVQVKPIFENQESTPKPIDHNKNLHEQIEATTAKVIKAMTQDENRKDELQKLKKQLSDKAEELVKQIKNLSKFDNEASKNLKESFQSQLIEVQGQLTKVIEEERKILEREAQSRG
ncbi:hypothetical protein A3K86_21125 [Photobacterium jeanii]|uniref:Uncharacterized protein n=1 Tax=Photobacterium jeanii TaxID=858640 RepID=A0A178K2W3_9GAMM|nr:hypothetical protein [Photobacterium jeanii]OAN11446.1 hypothetical protein A3K86_21125 [Photobacterium jeanii]PST90965.1 hypothetical protein C9I91_10230 [Photobacterium jeanii]